MGLLKAAFNAIDSTLSDQWLDLIKCENMGMDTLMVKQTTKSGQISKSSRIIVAPGQVAVIYDTGQVLDATAEEGVYTFDQSSSPSFFGGQFGPVFKEMWQRFTYGGTPAKEQAVFYFNVKEILDNKFGTPAPVTFPDWSHPIPNQMTGTLSPMSLKVRCFGKYTFRIDDMGLFMRAHAGTGDVIKKDNITEQMRSEVVAAFQMVLNEMGNSEHRVPYLELPSHTLDMKKAMDEKVFDEPIRNRGIRLVSFTVESVTPDAESDKKLNEYEHNSNAMMQQGRIIDVMEKAAGNEGGAANGFIGLGMMNMTTGGMTGGIMQNTFGGAQQPNAQMQYDPYGPRNGGGGGVPTPTMKCPKCGADVTGKFCSNCGTEMPQHAAPKKCPKCGADVTGKFCSNCGTEV